MVKAAKYHCEIVLRDLANYSEMANLKYMISVEVLLVFFMFKCNFVHIVSKSNGKEE